MEKMGRTAVQIQSDLDTFFTFATDFRLTSADELVKALSRLMVTCPTARPAVLSLIGSLFEEYCLLFVQNSAGNQSFASPGRYLSLLTSENMQPGQRELLRRVSSDRRTSSESSNVANAADETPASPPPASSCDISVPGSDEPDPNECIDSFIDQILETLLSFVESKDRIMQRTTTDWTLHRLCSLSSHFQPLKERLFSQSKPMSDPDTALVTGINEKIDYWRKCSVFDVLIKIVLKSLECKALDMRDVLLQLMTFKPSIGTSAETEWICCCLITEAQKFTGTASCIEFLLQSKVTESTKEAIFSFLSSQNPESVISCAKSNILFLLRLCSKSQILLNVLSRRMASTKIDVNILNQQVKDFCITDDPQLKRDVMQCLISSENAFHLFITVCHVSVDPNANQFLHKQSVALLQAVVDEAHTFVYARTGANMEPFLNQLKQHYEQVISDPKFGLNDSLKRIQIQLMKLLCVHFDFQFTTLLLHEMFKRTAPQTPCDIFNLSKCRPNSVLKSLFRSLGLTFGAQMRDMCNKLLAIEKEKNNNFWVNIFSFVASGSEIEAVDLNLITNHLTDFVQLDLFGVELDDRNEKRMESLIIVLEIIRLTLEHNRCLAARNSHNLCHSLVINYVSLVERIEIICEGNNMSTQMDMFIHALCTSQKIVRILSEAGTGSTNQQILTRIFMECILCWNLDLEKERGMKEKSVVDVSLKVENMNYAGAGCKFRKIPLNPSKDFCGWNSRINHKPPLSRLECRQLLLDGIKSCIKNMALFSLLLVEIVTPDVMFNDPVWPEEEFLKVTIERDLLIYKKYEEHSILWDLTELVADAGHLQNCSVLVRALLAVQLTYWASGTSSEKPNPNSLNATQRLLTLLSSSGMIPTTPFKFLPDVLPHLNSWEIACVSSDLWKMIRDMTMTPPSSTLSLKPYLERLRIIMGHKCPGEAFVRIFRSVK